MRSTRLFLVSAVALWLAAAFQQAISPRMAIWDASPDFLLIAIACLSLFASRGGAASIGFVGGVMHGAIAGANMGAYAFTRTVAGFLIGWFSSVGLEASGFVAFVAAFSATLGADLLRMFLAPPAGIAAYLLATIASAVYNGVIAVPLYVLLRRFLDPPLR